MMGLYRSAEHCEICDMITRTSGARFMTPVYQTVAAGNQRHNEAMFSIVHHSKNYRNYTDNLPPSNVVYILVECN